jgi:hypothetical protein
MIFTWAGTTTPPLRIHSVLSTALNNAPSTQHPVPSTRVSVRTAPSILGRQDAAPLDSPPVLLQNE